MQSTALNPRSPLFVITPDATILLLPLAPCSASITTQPEEPSQLFQGAADFLDRNDSL